VIAEYLEHGIRESYYSTQRDIYLEESSGSSELSPKQQPAYQPIPDWAQFRQGGGIE